MLLSLFLLCVQLGQPLGPPIYGTPADYIKSGSFLIGYKPGQAQAVKDLCKKLDITVEYDGAYINILQCKTPQNLDYVLRQLNRPDLIKYVQPNYRIELIPPKQLPHRCSCGG